MRWLNVPVFFPAIRPKIKEHNFNGHSQITSVVAIWNFHIVNSLYWFGSLGHEKTEILKQTCKMFYNILTKLCILYEWFSIYNIEAWKLGAYAMNNTHQHKGAWPEHFEGRSQTILRHVESGKVGWQRRKLISFDHMHMVIRWIFLIFFLICQIRVAVLGVQLQPAYAPAKSGSFEF